MVSLCPCGVTASHDAITDKAFEQDWGLDATGNWEEFDQDPDGDKSRAATGGASYRSEQDGQSGHPPAPGPPGLIDADHTYQDDEGLDADAATVSWASARGPWETGISRAAGNRYDDNGNREEVTYDGDPDPKGDRRRVRSHTRRRSRETSP